MIFYALTSAGPEGGGETQPERRGFQHLQRGPAVVNVSEKPVQSLLLHKNIFSLGNFGENATKSFFLLYL